MKLLATLITLTLSCFAVPFASEQGANDGFILFTTDRDNPSTLGICPNCEDIYVMSPDGTNPTRLTFGGGALTDPDAVSLSRRQRPRIHGANLRRLVRGTWRGDSLHPAR